MADFQMSEEALAAAAAEVAPQFEAFRAEVEANRGSSDEEAEPTPAPPPSTEAPEWPAGETPAPPSEPEPPVPEQPAPAGHFINDFEFEQFQAYQALAERLRSDEDFAERFRRLDEPPQPPQWQSPQPTVAGGLPAQYPESYLASDPAWQAAMAQMNEQNRVIAQLQAVVNDQRRAENDATRLVVERAFKDSHGLDDKAFKAVYDHAQGFAGMMPALAARGVPANEALEQVLDAAYWSMPEMREVAYQRDAERRKADQARKAKAGSLSGSSGSVPRTAAFDLPKTEQGRRDALAKMAGQLMNGELE